MANIVVTRNWLVALGNANDAVATALLEQGLLLDELQDIKLEDIKTICYAARRSAGDLLNGDPNHGVNVPALLHFKLRISM